MGRLLHGAGPGLDPANEGLRDQRGEHEARKESPRLHGSCCSGFLSSFLPLLLLLWSEVDCGAVALGGDELRQAAWV